MKIMAPKKFMHSVMLVMASKYATKISKDGKKSWRAIKFKDSEHVRKSVMNWLADEGFAQQGFFARGVADWYVIGGRWSGMLDIHRLDPIRRTALEEDMHAKFPVGATTEEYKPWITKRFKEYFPRFKGPNPYLKPKDMQYNPLGQACDAQIVDSVLYSNLIKKWIEEHKECDEPRFVVMEDPEEGLGTITKEKVVGKYWVVVIDYHT